MDRGVANTVKTLAFCLSTPTVRTRIHFFPSAGSVGGAAGVNCTLKLFGKGFERRAVLLDGGRIGQPDGVRLEDAFPHVRSEASGILGLEVTLECPQGQGRVNLQSSHSTIEFISPQFSIAYGSAPFLALREGEQGSVTERLIAARRRNRVGAGIHDSLLTTSLVVINSSREPLRPDVLHTVGQTEVALPLGTVAPESVVEIPLDESLFKGKESQPCLWGEVCAAKIGLGESASSGDAGYYLVYREPNTKRPISVCAL
jgi:hypothetical protein